MLLCNLISLPIISCFILFCFAEASLKEFIKFRQVEYEDLPTEGNFPFSAYNNIPQGFSPYISNKSSRIFIAVPRRYPGVPSTLNYIKLDEGQGPYIDPKLKSFPSYEMNELDPLNRPNPNKIVSVYRPRVDECERLWFVDSGVINTSGNATIVQRPSIWMIDLRTDTVLNRYEIPPPSSGSGFASITIDVIDCDQNSFAYLPDLIASQILVYSLKENRSYIVNHNFLHMHPFQGDYSVDNLKFAWDDNVFSIALSEREKDSSYRLAYFHPMSSFSEFAVSTRVLRNESLATRSYHDSDFKLIGNRGNSSQSTMHGVHQKTGIMFFAEINKNAVSCWNTKKSSLMPSKVGQIAQDDVNLIYPSDLNVDENDLWVLSNRMIRHLYAKLDTDDFNFRIFRSSVEDVVKGSKCEADGGRKRKRIILRKAAKLNGILKEINN